MMNSCLSFLILACTICASLATLTMSVADQAKHKPCMNRLSQSINKKVAHKFSSDHLTRVCHHEELWTGSASVAIAADFAPRRSVLKPKQQEYVDRVWKCNLTALQQPPCTSYSGCKSGESVLATRMEYRMMSDAQRAAFHDAMNLLKKTTIDGVSKFDLIIGYHNPSQAPGAHFGPAFLPWHREYLFRMEVALRLEKPELIGLPYWNTTLDNDLPNAAHSIIWSEQFLGNGDGEVTSGPFRCWSASGGSSYLSRAVGAGPYNQSALYSQSDYESIMTAATYDNLTWCVDQNFELIHGLVHEYVGGHMENLTVAPNDPAFFLHHCFIDHLWEQFRQRKQSMKQREQDYPSIDYSCRSTCYAMAQMSPFDQLTNIKGLSNIYTAHNYTYRPIPASCSSYNPCGSDYLFCDTKARVCRSKVRPGGDCKGYEGTAICYRGQCEAGGVCSGTPEVKRQPCTMEVTTTATPEVTEPTVPTVAQTSEVQLTSTAAFSMTQDVNTKPDEVSTSESDPSSVMPSTLTTTANTQQQSTSEITIRPSSTSTAKPDPTIETQPPTVKPSTMTPRPSPASTQTTSKQTTTTSTKAPKTTITTTRKSTTTTTRKQTTTTTRKQTTTTTPRKPTTKVVTTTATTKPASRVTDQRLSTIRNAYVTVPPPPYFPRTWLF